MGSPPHSVSSRIPGGSTSAFSGRPHGGKRQHFSQPSPAGPGLQVIRRNSRAAITLSHFCLPGRITWFEAVPGLLTERAGLRPSAFWSHAPCPGFPHTRALTGQFVRGCWALAQGHCVKWVESECQGHRSSRDSVRHRLGWASLWGRRLGTQGFEVDFRKSPASDQTA